MSLQRSQKTTTYRTVKVSSPETVTNTVISARPVSPAGSVSTTGSVSPMPYSLNGYETVRYLVPMQQQQQSYIPVQQAVQQQSYIPVQQAVQQQSYVVMQQPMMQQVVSPVYLQGLQHLSVSSQDSNLLFQQQSTVEEEEESVEVEEVEIVNIIQQKPVEKITRVEVKSEVKEVPPPTKMDTRYFGELLADVYRKNCDIHSCISEHVTKIRGQKYQLDHSNDYKVEREEVESLLPKGATELTKQQIRYLLQTRLTADKSMRLLLSTFSSLREELLHMSEDLRRLESEKEALERDLSFKADQARQYDSLLEAVRENNRQLQLSLKETSASQRSLESQLMSSRTTDSSREFKVKELEGRLRAMEKENEMLRQKLAGQGSSTTLHIKTEELSQITKIQTQITTTTTTSSSSEKSLQLKISELLATLEKRQTTITRQEEEIRKLMQERNDSSKNVTKTIITKRYRNQYPILGLLSDDYQVTSPVKEAKTIVIERTGEMIKQRNQMLTPCGQMVLLQTALLQVFMWKPAIH
ncbi:Protein POF1B [Nibea albiflora]|uniref:Protein POF1B n=1 Tax=Nibea albiflora TaxID=240163 RepID=A0ACB7F3I7_NIBAL|nr:Protein POF1B [Nibea albiflora]